MTDRTKARLAEFARLAAQYEAAGISPAQAGDRAFLAVQDSPPPTSFGEPK